MDAILEIQKIIESSGMTEKEKDTVRQIADVLIRAQETAKQESCRNGQNDTMQRAGQAESDEICKLECNVDDCTGEALGFAMERLLKEGALDVNYVPMYMKKNRPAYLLTVLCKPSDRVRMEEILFTETTTIGVRRQFMQRTVLERENQKMMTSLGEVDVKILYQPDGKRYAPEYESVARIAREKGMAFRKVFQMIEAEVNPR